MAPRTVTRPPASLIAWLALAVFALALASTVRAVKRNDFKTCAQSGFCHRNRLLADRARDQPSGQWKSPYRISASNPFDPTTARLGFNLSNQLFPDVHFTLELEFQLDGVARVVLDERNGLRQRYNEAHTWAIQQSHERPLDRDVVVEQHDKPSRQTSVTYGRRREHRVVVDYDPVKLTFMRDGQPHVVLNDRGLFNMEHFRLKPVGEPATATADEIVVDDPGRPGEETVVVPRDAFPGFLPDNEDGMWEETFNGKRDSKPKGPESLSLDITFPGYEHVYGIPQHASSLSLKETRGGDGAYSDPYRLYNLDVFEYETDSEMAIYGSIPFMKAHRAGSTVGVFLVTGSETWIDITKDATPRAVSSAFKKRDQKKKTTTKNGGDAGPSGVTTSTHWIAESGILDLFVFLGPGPDDVLREYTSLTGTAALPQLFALAYHQCRWNYLDEDDVLEVQRRFDEADIPVDVVWLDIEYAEEHKYFVWDKRNFPTPERMQDKLAEKGRKLVAIVDPHIKRDPSLYVYSEARELDILSKQPDGTTEFEGWCWTGSSAWIDCFNPKTWDWWPKMFKFDKFKGSTPNLFIWNDMNEPSIFNGPEITMQKDAIHYGGWEHRDVHNIGGMIYHNLTARGLIERQDPPRRPFVLTRAFYAGSQRFGAMWTGDNLGTWRHLQSTVPMLLTSGIAGMTFAGSDVGGFFGNPGAEMMTRWHQVGAFSPFFRAHGHIDTKRREVYLWDEPYQGIMRDAIRLRYSLLPAMYTAFYESSLTGIPILRPQYIVFPDDPRGFALDDQFYLGSSGLLVKPVVEEGQTEQSLYISDSEPYYHYETHDVYFGGSSHITVPAPLSSIPVLHRGGSILARRDLVRRASTLTWKDPITLVVAVDVTGTRATGTVYLDDGESYDHERGDFVHRQFDLAPRSLEDRSSPNTLVLANRPAPSPSPTSSSALDPKHDPEHNAWADKISDVAVREVVVLGLASEPSCVRVDGHDDGLEFEWVEGVAATGSRRSSGKRASELRIKDANAMVVRTWDLVFEFDSASSPSSRCRVRPRALDRDAQRLVESQEHCPVGQFYCQNQGHVAACILGSRLNDGVCDPECCDGSDETDGKVECRDVCARVGAEHAKERAELERKQRVGGAVRDGYVKHGRREKDKLEREIARLEREVEELERDALEVERRLGQLERAEAGEIARKKNSVLYAKLTDMQHAIKALRSQRKNLEGHVDNLSGILSDLSRDFNPNYQDMAVLGASRAFKDWQVANGIEEADNGDTASYARQSGEGDGEGTLEMTDEELARLEEEDPLALIDSLGTQVGTPLVPEGISNIFRIEDYVPDRLLPSYKVYKQAFVDLLVRTGIIYGSSRGGDRDGHDGTADSVELAKVRARHTKVTETIEERRSKLERERQALDKDWGRDWEWKKLEGTCVEQDSGEYTYSVCFFGEAIQKSNNNGARTSLGHFKGWHETADRDEDATGYYSRQVYADGQRCWNGPSRSARVELECGTSNQLVKVVEPEKCEYVFTVTSPAVCYPSPVAADEVEIEGRKRDEL